MVNNNYGFFKNSVFTALGWIVPILVNFVTVPIIVRNLGYDAYGVWTIVMAVMGYFALLDLGVVKGGIRFLAEANARGDAIAANQVVSIGLIFYLVIGAVGGLCIAVSVDSFLLDLIKIPDQLRPTARIVFYLASFGFFATMLQTYLLSLPQAIHRFDVSNTIDSVNQIFTSIITVLVVVLGYGLVSVIVVRILGNLLCSVSLARAMHKCMPDLRFTTRLNWRQARQVFSYSLISFVGRIGTATATQLQTVIVGSLLGSTAVTIFSIPFQLIGRVMGISYRLSMLIFPVSSELSGSLDKERLQRVYLGMTRPLFFISMAQVVLFSSFSWEILRLWMGAEFADKAYLILIMIAIGYFFDTLTNLPSQVCDGLGHPRITSMFAFIRGGVGILLTLAGGYMAGVQGVAAGYMLSCVIVSIVFNIYIHSHVILMSYTKVLRICGESAIFGLLLSGLIMALQRSRESFSVPSFLAEAMGATMILVLFGYARVLDTDSRLRLKEMAVKTYGQLATKIKC